MKRKIVPVILMAIVLMALPGATEDSTALTALRTSALRSPSYRGGIEDVFVNPASLPLIIDQKLFKLSLGASEAIDSSVLSSSPTGYIQNLMSEGQGTVVSGSMALSAKFSNKLTERRLSADDTPLFDIYTGVDIEIDLGYRLGRNFSFGIRLGGGNSMVRRSKEVTGYISVVENALFSPYEKTTESQRFNSTLGLMVFNDNFALGMTTSSIIGGDVSLGGYFTRLMGNTTVALSYTAARYSREGELNLLVPRLGASLTGMGVGEDRSISLSGDLRVQFLKNTYIDGGVKYLYEVDNEGMSTLLCLSILGVKEDFSLGVNIAFDFSGDEDFLPSIVFTYSN